MMRHPTLLPTALLLALAACQDPEPSAAVPPPPPVTEVAPPPVPPATAAALPAARWEGRPAGREWTRFALAAIEEHGGGLVAAQPADIGAYCPRYAQAGATERRAFWVGLMSALARPESDFNPTLTFTEPGILDQQGNRVVSRGLLQISQESANGYGCRIADAQALHDPATNLSCAARIMNRLVTRDGVIGSEAAPWKGMSAYWSPFRRANTRAELREWTSAQGYCR